MLVAMAYISTIDSSGDEIANFLYHDIVHAKELGTCTKNTIDSCINSATDRFYNAGLPNSVK